MEGWVVAERGRASHWVSHDSFCQLMDGGIWVGLLKGACGASLWPLSLLGSPGPKSPAVRVLAEQWCRVFCSISGSSRLDTVSSIVSVSLYPLWSFLAPESLRAKGRLGVRLGQMVWWVPVSSDCWYKDRKSGMLFHGYQIWAFFPCSALYSGHEMRLGWLCTVYCVEW